MENINELQHSGLKVDWQLISERDYMFGSDLSDKMKNIKPDTVKYEYNQGAQYYTRNACTLYMGIGMLSDLFGYKFSEEEILDICNLAESKYWWSPSWGNYLYKSIDCVRHWWNAKYPDKKIVSFAVTLTSPEAQRLLDAGKTLGIGFNTSTKHYYDAQDNGNLDNPSFAGAEKKGGHAVRINKYTTIDNYNGKKKYNKYGTLRLIEYVREGTYFQHWYVFFKENEDDPMKALLSNIKYKRAQAGVLAGVWNGENPDKPATRQEVASMVVSAMSHINPQLAVETAYIELEKIMK